MSKISNLIDFYNSKSLNTDKISSNSSKFTGHGILDYPKTRKKEISQLTTLSNSDINIICNTLKIPLKGVFMKDEFKLPLSDGNYGHMPIRPSPFGPTTYPIWAQPIWSLQLGPSHLGPAFRPIPIGPVMFRPILFGPMVVSDFTLSIN